MKHKIFFVLFIIILPNWCFGEVDASACNKSIVNIRNPDISCTAIIKLNDEEKAEVKKSTSGVIDNLLCQLNINANKSEIIKNLSEPVVNLPQLKISCDIKFNDNKSNTAIFSIAPTIEFTENIATNLTLNLSEITGIGFIGKVIAKQLSNEQTEKQVLDAVNKALANLQS